MWARFFKPEVRSAGLSLFKLGKVSSSVLSDTEIQGYVKGSTSFKVVFKSPSVSSSSVFVDCSCPASLKGRFCKHIWGFLLKSQDDHPDFFEGKAEIEKASVEFSSLNDSAAKIGSPKMKSSALSAAQVESRAKFKEKQKDYQKLQYQKQKLRAKQFKDFKKESKGSKLSGRVAEKPAPVDQALRYFSRNGFPMDEAFDVEGVRFAKKKLAHIFHPDKGGSHDEIVELNENFEVLMAYLQGQSS